MDISNASVYDGATAAAEAMSMMYQIGRKKKKTVPDFRRDRRGQDHDL
jgi:glycine cleavage system pyridoxal-binding protein P